MFFGGSHSRKGEGEMGKGGKQRERREREVLVQPRSTQVGPSWSCIMSAGMRAGLRLTNYAVRKILTPIVTLVLTEREVRRINQ